MANAAGPGRSGPQVWRLVIYSSRPVHLRHLGGLKLIKLSEPAIEPSLYC
jgi:hypothetical protein